MGILRKGGRIMMISIALSSMPPALGIVLGLLVLSLVWGLIVFLCWAQGEYEWRKGSSTFGGDLMAFFVLMLSAVLIILAIGVCAVVN
jgi:hypothetical protein